MLSNDTSSQIIMEGGLHPRQLSGMHPISLSNNPVLPLADIWEKQYAPVHHIQPDTGDGGWVKEEGHR